MAKQSVHTDLSHMAIRHARVSGHGILSLNRKVPQGTHGRVT
ncbi:hypothetical protein F383_18853 [Gossypium arboreum]|uniref:Uncharacterized protein n=1 Tax=Gossypium arboreum TaxID=29729 RepID=A0A0B0NJV6_GOSAR|nr:hypothetical protein F383_18853 [Gossypium arboreum]